MSITIGNIRMANNKSEINMTTALTKTNPQELAKTKFESLSKKELLKVIQDFVLPISDPEKYKAFVQSAMPEFVRKIDDAETRGTTIMQMTEEMMLAIVETLKLYHDFSDSAISQFLKNLRGNLTIVEKIEEGGLSMLSDHSMAHVVQMVKETGVEKMLEKIAETRYQKERTWKAGLEHPRVLEGSKIERQIQKPRR